MIRTYTTGLALATAAFCSHAQITVTNSVFPAIGDTLHYAYGNQPDAIFVVLTPPGGPQTWDLSALQADSTWNAIYQDPSTGAGSAAFPNATLRLAPAAGAPGQEDYLEVTTTDVQNMGSYGADPLHLGSSWSVHALPPLPERWAPVNFFDIRAESSGSITTFMPSEMPPGTVDALGISVDSMRFRVWINMTSVVDAFGDMIIPGGVHAVLRERWTTYLERRLDLHSTLLGWIDVTTDAIQDWGMGEPLGVDTLITYHFINDVSKETIAVCELNNAQNAVLRVRYKVADFSTAMEGAALPTAVVVSPNPASASIRLQAPWAEAGAINLRVHDATGREVLRSAAWWAGPGTALEQDVNSLPSGSYTGSLTNADGEQRLFRFAKQ